MASAHVNPLKVPNVLSQTSTRFRGAEEATTYERPRKVPSQDDKVVVSTSQSSSKKISKKITTSSSSINLITAKKSESKQVIHSEKSYSVNSKNSGVDNNYNRESYDEDYDDDEDYEDDYYNEFETKNKLSSLSKRAVFASNLLEPSNDKKLIDNHIVSYFFNNSINTKPYKIVLPIFRTAILPSSDKKLNNFDVYSQNRDHPFMEDPLYSNYFKKVHFNHERGDLNKEIIHQRLFSRIRREEGRIIASQALSSSYVNSNIQMVSLVSIFR